MVYELKSELHLSGLLPKVRRKKCSVFRTIPILPLITIDEPARIGKEITPNLLMCTSVSFNNIFQRPLFVHAIFYEPYLERGKAGKC